MASSGLDAVESLEDLLEAGTVLRKSVPATEHQHF